MTYHPTNQENNMSVNAEELASFVDKKVVLHTINKDDGGITERHGKVEAASQFGVAFKEKGKSSADLYEIDQIEEIAGEPTAPKKIRQKKLEPVEADRVRQHLVDRHGMPLSKANEMSDEDAAKLHDNIDHSNLGHKHEAKEETSQEQAVANAEADAA